MKYSSMHADRILSDCYHWYIIDNFFFQLACTQDPFRAVRYHFTERKVSSQGKRRTFAEHRLPTVLETFAEHRSSFIETFA